MIHTTIKHSMPQMIISLVILYQPTGPPTLEAVTLSQLGTWKTLPNTPTYNPAAAVLAGKLLAIGGKETSEGGADMKEVYMYSTSTNFWIYISDLPAPRYATAAAVLSPTEILVIMFRVQ